MTENSDVTASGNIRLITAHKYRLKKWPIIPVYWPINGKCACGSSKCSSPAKHPITKNGLKDASIREEDIDKWWGSLWPDANIGVCCGRIPGTDRTLVCLDVDYEKGGLDSLSAFESSKEPLPPSPQQITGAGMHYIATVPSSIDVRNSVSLIGPGIDLRSTGGFFVAAPSMHISGRRYTWDAGFDFEDTELAELPEWLISLAMKRRMTPQLSGPGKAEGAWIEGSRNNALARIAGSMRRMGSSEKAIFRHLLLENEERCVPPLDELEVRRIAASVSRYRPSEDPSSGRATPRGTEPAPVDPNAVEKSEDWRGKLLWKNTKMGAVVEPVHANVVSVLTLCPDWAGGLAYDMFAERVMIQKEPPWFPEEKPGIDGEVPRVWDDTDDTRLACWLKRKDDINISLGETDIARAVVVAAQKNGYHEIRDYLKGLEWDGIERISGLFSTYFGAENSLYCCGVSRMWMVSAVARVFEPGCKVDHVPILEGLQGAGKSSGLRALAGGRWFMDSPIDVHSKEGEQVLRGKWICEFAELDSLSRGEVAAVRRYITQQDAHYRSSYGRHAKTVARQCVFIGTTNDFNSYLQDPTGARRFWPVRCGNVRNDLITRDRDQLWAEAVWQYINYHIWHPTEQAMIDAAKLEQEARYSKDPWEAIIEDWLEGKWEPRTGNQIQDARLREESSKILADVDRMGLSTHDVLLVVLQMQPGRTSKSDERRAAVILRRLGFEYKRRIQDKNERSYRYMRLQLREEK